MQSVNPYMKQHKKGLLKFIGARNNKSVGDGVSLRPELFVAQHMFIIVVLCLQAPLTPLPLWRSMNSRILLVHALAVQMQSELTISDSD